LSFKIAGERGVIEKKLGSFGMICALLVFPNNFASSARASSEGENHEDQVWSQPNTKRKRLLPLTKISGDS